MDPLRHLQAELDRLAAAGLLRTEPPPPAAGQIVLGSNDYLGLAARPLAVPEAGVASRAGAGGSRLTSGDHPEHAALERALCAWLGYEAALVFGSGYAANLGLLGALCGPGDVIVSDALNHASIIDGCRLARARVVVVPHLDAAAAERALGTAAPGAGALSVPAGRGSGPDARCARVTRAPAAGRRWLVTESYFSMQGTTPDLVRLRAACDAHGAALVVDEAHAIGVFGPEGRGLCCARGVKPDVLVGTLGKALGLQGAFVLGSSVLRRWLWNRARSFVYSTGLSPALAAAARARVAAVAAAEPARRRLHELSARVRRELDRWGAPLGASHGPIIPWLAGSPQRALDLSAALAARGIVVPAVRPPTVPEGQSGLRISLRANLSDDEVQSALDGFARVLGAG
ncbi:MAG: 8-amino-7-oxononanoate synthase [Deltaproteobacteria bacterium]|nr:8-amino-7-oxononanoate synthase [Deltaproteobacteria bacterium]